MIGFNKLSAGQAHIFKLPLPASLESQKEWRRVKITLAWFSPIEATSQKYRTASLWFDLVDNNSNFIKRTGSDWQAVKRGTVQHEVFEGAKAVSFPYEKTLNIRVNCTENAAEISSPVLYSLAVTLEISEGVDIPIYDEVREIIASKIQIEAK